MAMLQVRLLGTFDIRHKNKSISISSRPAQSLFAYLILNAGSSHRREKLAGMLWPDSLEETARDNLRHALWRVRKALQSMSATSYLQANDLTITFNASIEYWLDAAELEMLSDNASADELIAVLSAYNGELLPGFYEEWVALEREHLSSIFEHHMARLLSLLQEEKRWLEILDWGERWVKLGQKPEPAYRAVMTAHAAKGDMSKVAAIYERCLKSLREFGMEPSEQTKALYANLKAGKETPKDASVSTKPFVKESSSNIPVPLTSFIGREKELQEIARRLSSSRLLTLTGPGGVGKTRLAVQTAHNSIKKFKDGVFWVGLVGLSDENLIPQAIAGSLNVREVPDQPLIETLKTYLKPKEVLLVIDNCEHLIRVCAQVAEQLLAACPKLTILATSIEALGLFHETIWQVPSLPLPETQRTLSLKDLREFASIKLFQERASNAKAGFVLDERNAFSIAQICRHLDGMPLAIELAAARIKVLSADEIASRLDNRFSLLTAGSRTAVPRHQTLRATIDWSYDLLTEAERSLLRRLSVFAGGFTLEAAEAVCGYEDVKRSDILDLLGRLVDKSLVIAEGYGLGETRYRLLETIRQYALEKLTEIGEEAREIRNRHSEFFVKWIEAVEPNIFGSDSAIWFQRLEKELDNIRAAMDWSTNYGNAVNTLRIAGAIATFWFLFVFSLSLSEWHNRVRQALARPEGLERTVARAKALNGIGFLLWVEMYPIDIRLELEEALAIAREHEDNWNVAAALRNLGLFASVRGTFVEARTFFLQSLKAWREMVPADKMEIGRTLMFLGDAALTHHETEQAHSVFEESIEILRDFGNQNLMAMSVRRLGQLALRGGDYEKAARLCKESLNLNQNTGDFRGVLACVAELGNIATTQENFDRAITLMAAVESQLAQTRIRLLPVDKTEHERNLALVRTQLDDKVFHKSWDKGKALSLEETIAFALEEA
jgi:predicted ATPase/DNA-binding SARP family transcriptional activator